MGTVDPESLRGFAHVPEPDTPVVTDNFFFPSLWSIRDYPMLDLTYKVGGAACEL